MNLDKVYYHLRKSVEEMDSLTKSDSTTTIVDDTDYKLAMARLYDALNNYTNQVNHSIR